MHFKAFVFLLATVYSFSGPWAFATNLQVIDGDRMSRFEVARSPLVKLYLRRNMICSGTLVAPDLVLTAAHCLSDLRRINVQVYFVRDEILQSLRVPITQVWVHPNYEFEETDEQKIREQIKYDVALIRILREVPSEKPTARILPRNRQSQIDERIGRIGGIVMGYGETRRTYPGEFAAQGAAYFADLSSFQIPFTNEYASDYFNAYQNEVIVADGSLAAHMCYGDSGGPLFLNIPDQWIVAAVNSAVLYTANGDTNCRVGSVHAVLSSRENSEFLGELVDAGLQYFH